MCLQQMFLLRNKKHVIWIPFRSMCVLLENNSKVSVFKKRETLLFNSLDASGDSSSADYHCKQFAPKTGRT